jgi:hypothetical protein
MVGSDLGAAIKAAIDSLGSDASDRDTLFSAMGSAIVTYIQAHALVTVAVASVSGVTAGGGTSGPGTGTGTIN